jgi:hypothetical protein
MINWRQIFGKVKKFPFDLNEKPDSEFKKDQLEKGTKSEKEHTDIPELARSIAKDHLEEVSDYYTKLDRYVEYNKIDSSLKFSWRSGWHVDNSSGISDSGASGAAHIELPYEEIRDILGVEGNEDAGGEYPEISWHLVWDDDLEVSIGQHTKNWDMDDEADNDDHWDALREHGNFWTVWVGSSLSSQESEIIERLCGMFGKANVSYYGKVD